jgi:hypothetical protein
MFSVGSVLTMRGWVRMGMVSGQRKDGLDVYVFLREAVLGLRLGLVSVLTVVRNSTMLLLYPLVMRALVVVLVRRNGSSVSLKVTAAPPRFVVE